MTLNSDDAGSFNVTINTADLCSTVILCDGIAKTPAADHLFEVRECELVDEETADWFHRQTAKVLYLAKRTRPECLTAVAFLATRVTKCDSDNVGKLQRLLKYIRRTRSHGIILRPGVRGIAVRPKGRSSS